MPYPIYLFMFVFVFGFPDRCCFDNTLFPVRAPLGCSGACQNFGNKLVEKNVVLQGLFNEKHSFPWCIHLE
jgi:hypothetical protein